jgi:hypothetical protein
MVNALETDAERRAEAAESLPAFSGLKLLHVKKQLEVLLGLIGRDGIFDEYTRHDIGHIDAMLQSLDWLIPDSSKATMTPADWLVAVLGIYFHDLGMLVTRKEYEGRRQSGFDAFVEDILFAGDQGKDYRARVDQLPSEQRERFLYQEFVRYHHAERIKWWIMGDAPSHLGDAHDAEREVDRLLQTLDPLFRRDLGLVCESHHKYDLDDFDKYQTSRPYGSSKDETANLHFASILLRTADLLHVTGDRTPSVSFRVINPVDPVSQQEWAKQMAVRNVRPQFGKDREGNVSESAPRDTIEVWAYFTKQDGFFGLTSYLAYAGKEIRRCYDWAHAATQSRGVKLAFPWRYLDDSHIETKNFEPQPFEFSIDQARILDLLTGHTLYNDTSVVVRELIQNALDAIRLQRTQDKPPEKGSCDHVSVVWDSGKRLLTVTDTRTGMTQTTIENHLLRVGASLYQDPEFRKSHPDFSPISRFGIGILSTFMIADAVDITTCHPAEDEARRLSLRSVHGKYLVQRLPKHDQEVADIRPHGTRVAVVVRPSADVEDILETVRKWVVFPVCPVFVTVDQGAPMRVGHYNTSDYLKEALAHRGFIIVDRAAAADGAVCVEERHLGDVSLAYALRWSETFREWSFLAATDKPGSDKYLTLGTCVEGIRVLFSTPGFDGMPLVAIANAVGKTAPKTNVARSGLENTPELKNLLSRVYSMYCLHIAGELGELQKRGFSLTWAAQEVEYLLPPLLGEQPSDRAALESALEEIPAVTIEGPQGRSLEAIRAIHAMGTFWTVEWPLAKTAEWLIAESQGSVSLGALVHLLGYADTPFPAGTRVCRAAGRSRLAGKAFANRQIRSVTCFPDLRRVDITWGPLADGGWRFASKFVTDCVSQILLQFEHGEMRRFYIPAIPASLPGIPGASFIVTPHEIVLLNGPLAERCAKLMGDPRVDAPPDGLPSPGGDLAMLLALCSSGLLPQYRRSWSEQSEDLLKHVRHGVRAYGYDDAKVAAVHELLSQVQEALDSRYDPYARSRLPGIGS